MAVSSGEWLLSGCEWLRVDVSGLKEAHLSSEEGLGGTSVHEFVLREDFKLGEKTQFVGLLHPLLPRLPRLLTPLFQRPQLRFQLP